VDLIVLREAFEEPEESYGLLQALLDEVGRGERGETALIFPCSRHVGVTRMDTRRPGFGRAVRAAEALGFPVLERRSGGGPIAANPSTLTFALFYPVEDLRRGIYDRYAEGTELVAAALGRAGVEAEPGEVEGEFCPGAYSVRAGGPRGVKLAGLSQRVTRRAARLEGIILVSGTKELAEVLERFYAQLGAPFRRGSVGDAGGAGVPDVMLALEREVRSRYGAVGSRLDRKTLEEARSHVGEYRVATGGRI
jgi:octanoyl-[GcvH]:protein N-octanoyltransferase